MNMIKKSSDMDFLEAKGITFDRALFVYWVS